MGRSAIREAKWHSFGQNILSIHENGRHLHVRNSRSVIPILSQKNPTHTIKIFQRIILTNFANTNFFKITGILNNVFRPQKPLRKQQ